MFFRNFENLVLNDAPIHQNKIRICWVFENLKKKRSAKTKSYITLARFGKGFQRICEFQKPESWIFVSMCLIRGNAFHWLPVDG